MDGDDAEGLLAGVLSLGGGKSRDGGSGRGSEEEVLELHFDGVVFLNEGGCYCIEREWRFCYRREERCFDVVDDDEREEGDLSRLLYLYHRVQRS